MVPLTHISSCRLMPGLCLGIAALGALMLPHSLVVGLCMVCMALSLAVLRAPGPEASSRIGHSTWTVRYGGEMTTLPLDRISEVRIDHPLDGPDRVHVLMTTGLCVPLPDAALPNTDALIGALRARDVVVRLS